MSKNVGFEWGYQPLRVKDAESNTTTDTNNERLVKSSGNLDGLQTGLASSKSGIPSYRVSLEPSYKYTHSQQNKEKKRAFYEETTASNTTTDEYDRFNLTSSFDDPSSTARRTIFRNKRHANTTRIGSGGTGGSGNNFALNNKLGDRNMGLSQTLPMNRIVELLDISQLQEIVLKLVEKHPELSETIYKECYDNNAVKNVVDSMVAKLDDKFEFIFKNIPFSKVSLENESLNDYCFERLKQHLVEFLNCCYEYCYSLELGNREQWRLMDFILLKLAKLPTFENPINNYYTNFCIEQIDKIFYKSLLATGTDDWVYLIGDRLLKHCEAIGHKKLNYLSHLINETYNRTATSHDSSNTAIITTGHNSSSSTSSSSSMNPNGDMMTTGSQVTPSIFFEY